MAGVKITACDIKSQVVSRQEKAHGFDVVIVTCEFEREMVDVWFAIDDEGRIAGLYMRPAASAQCYASPEYANPDPLHDQDVLVHAGGWPLPGTTAITMERVGSR